MILVTLGTQDKSFKRLLDAIQREIDKGNIKDKVIVQAGKTKYESNDMEIFDLIPTNKFSELVKKCDILITHGGVGCITTGLKEHKKIIGVARLKKYGEHTNDHQLQILENFSESGYILYLENLDELSEILEKAKTFKPKEYTSNTNNMINLLEKYIDNI